MTNFDIKINIRKLSRYISPSPEEDIDKIILKMIESFAHYVLNLYGQMIEESINSRRYRGKWEPVDDPEYVEYLGVSPSTEIIYLIQESLEVEKIGYNFVVRFNPYYKYPGTKIPLIRVLRAIENGTSRFNARPILAKSAIEIRKSLLDLWKGYLTMKGVI